ncbi:MAG: ABC transporter permease [Bacteroidetes bacterium]|jgi:putative ABC transport system permease protein|nr:ABC transporter permease [Bacteroidota bacterium]MBT3933482.1 ABC transporter permease [Bacteroidota bacterium]MBT4968803.1 ABC transporter permease [Bacteroidota bacterium]MBT5992478.1 ABC transporter permease [Bacteroidota bacterium]MBT6837113.1 ABC transporter permease [Bacteroidota bacterium]
MIWSIAWRNVWRNKVRSSIVIIAVCLGLMSGVFSAAFMKGWMGQRMDAVLLTEMSYIQIHHPEFKENYEFTYFVDNSDKIVQDIKSLDPTIKLSKRMVINSMVASAETGTGVMIKGIDPEMEKEVTNIYTKIVEGAYFEGISKNPVVIGKKLADKLDVSIRNKIIVTVQDQDGNVTSGAFRVAGIYKTSNTTFDGSTIFVRNSDLATLVGVNPEMSHEIALLLSDQHNLEETTQIIGALNPDLLTESWKDLSPEMGYMDDLMGVYMYFIIIIILFALCFAIINTMLMAVLERVKEIGMLMAVGMNKLRVFSMLMLESIFLTLSGGFLGIVLGYILFLFFQKNGIDMSIWGEGLEAMGFAAIIYPEFDYGMIIPIIILVILTGLLSSLYPAYKALKLNPADSIRTD